jgi:CHAD domain-containing protein
MSFSIAVGKNVEKQLQKIVQTQMQKAIDESKLKDIGADKAVHQIRKRCKKQRALLRLVHYGLQDKALYKQKDSHYKSIANLLAGARDKKVLGDTFSNIVKKYSLDANIYASLAQSIEDIQSQQDAASITNNLEQARTMLRQNADDVKKFTLQTNSFKDLEKGFKKTYAKTKKLFIQAQEDTSVEALHEWRKWCKYHWYQMQILSKNEKCLLNARLNRLELLADILGEYHDIAVFKEYLQSVSVRYEEEFTSYLERESEFLKKVSFEMGQELFCARPKKFVRYINAIFQL